MRIGDIAENLIKVQSLGASQQEGPLGGEAWLRRTQGGPGKPGRTAKRGPGQALFHDGIGFGI